MRVRDLLGFLFATVLFPVSLIPATAQDNEGFPILDDVKLLAEKVALPDLEGDNPFVLREQWFSGSVKPGNAKLLQLQLFRRNSYRFWLAVPNENAALSLNLYNSDGEIVETETVTYDSSNVASMVVEADATGLYYVRISLHTGIDQAQDWAMIYGYR